VTMLRVGSLPYLNSEPFFACFEGAELVPMMPSALGATMLRGELDAGLLSLADVLALGDAVDLLPFGIATAGATGSVHLWSHRPLDRLHGATIGVTGETSTSVRILRLLLERRYGVKDVRWTPSPPVAATPASPKPKRSPICGTSDTDLAPPSSARSLISPN
jgi:chorismate dehydratase